MDADHPLRGSIFHADLHVTSAADFERRFRLGVEQVRASGLDVHLNMQPSFEVDPRPDALDFDVSMPVVASRVQPKGGLGS